MKPSSIAKIIGFNYMLTTLILVLATSLFQVGAFGQENNIHNNSNNNKKYDIVLLNHNYNSEGLFSNELAGEILNNGTATIKAVEITGIFYDDQDNIIGKERSGTNPYAIKPGGKATFNIEIFDEGTKTNASSYDFTAKWKDEYLFSSYFTRLTGGEISSDGDDDADDDN
ncbi:MAG: FxLYD domain-containing protein [Candidatus Nitrosocosmicus sp.]